MAANTQNINAKAVFTYIVMPGIIPRAKELGASGFGYLAFLFASVFQAVRIFPAGHPFTRPENIGRFTIARVLAGAANHIEFKWKNIDQIAVFVAMVTAVILIILQFVLVLLGLFSGQAFAQGGNPSFTSMFETQNPINDIAFLMLDYVFGIPGAGGGMGPGVGFFGSSAIAAGPTPFHQGLHDLFKFYNLAILVVAVFIFIYYVFIVVMETAQTGVPFGRRFSKIYAPFRLIFALGLLVPLNYGFNAAQYITLYAAKMGSSFATNGWLLYNNALQDNPLGVDNASLVAKPNTPPIDELLYFGSVYHACREMYWIWGPKNYLAPGQEGTCIAAYVLINGQARQFVVDGAGACSSATGSANGVYTYEQAKLDFGKSDIEIVLGEYDTAEHSKYAGGVRPYCGKITLSLGNDNPSVWRSGQAGGGGNSQTSDGIRAIEKMYFTTLQAILNSSNQQTRTFAAFGERAAHSFVPAHASHDVCHASGILGDAGTCGQPNWDPPSSSFQSNYDAMATSIKTETDRAYTAYRNGLDMRVSADVRNRGWGGAGIWYNNIADINGAFTSAIYAAPSIKKYPEVMEYVKSRRQESDRGGSADACTLFSLKINPEGGTMKWQKPNDRELAEALNAAYQYFACEKTNQKSQDPSGGQASGQAGQMSNAASLRMGGTARGMTGNMFNDAISMIFGLNGLFQIRENSLPNPSTGQPAVHPLAQLSTIGKSLVENAIRNMGMAIGAAFGGGMLSALGTSFGGALTSISSMFVGIATIGLTAGFILYYILPFLPFIYFFFAVGSWVKSIFEAMVGVPLWALAHLKIDGDGFSGRSAAPGYFLILEIFLRPIVTLFGLIGGIAVFGAMAVALNLMFDLVISNVTGTVPRPDGDLTLTDIASFRAGLIDQFFFTIMYAILLYMMATASFKMIDTIPSKFMRWIGSSVSTFNDNKGDPTQNLIQYAAFGGSAISGQVLQGVQSGAGALGGAAGSLGRAMSEGGGSGGGRAGG